MNQPRLLLCTDLDRTLLPNGTQPESPGARSRFCQLADRPETTLVYVTGRHKALVLKAITNYSLPRPDLVVSDVGTTIYDLREGAWESWQDWHREIAPSWKGLSREGLHGSLNDLDALHLQEHEKQNTYKLSYYADLHIDHEALIAEIDRRLSGQGIAASLIWSVDEPAGIGLLDVVPRNATKLHAVEFLQQQLGFARKETVFSGDSGNDLPVLTSPVPAVLVANAAADVREAARLQADRAGNADAIYFARGGFMGMNGNYSAGILEGVIHYHPEMQSWFSREPDKV